MNTIMGDNLIAAITGGVLVLEPTYEADGISTHTPALIIASYLADSGVMSVPSTGNNWPLYVSSLPDGDEVKDNAGAVYNTSPVKDGRWMQDGSVVQHYGVQVKIRSTKEDVGWDKCNTLALELDKVHNAEVIEDSIIYQVQNVTRTGGISSLGLEPGTRRRYLFTINFLAAITKL